MVLELRRLTNRFSNTFHAPGVSSSLGNAFTHRGLLEITGKYFSHLADEKRGLEVKLRVEKLNCLPDSGETAPCKKTELLI